MQLVHLRRLLALLVTCSAESLAPALAFARALAQRADQGGRRDQDQAPDQDERDKRAGDVQGGGQLRHQATRAAVLCAAAANIWVFLAARRSARSVRYSRFSRRATQS